MVVALIEQELTNKSSMVTALTETARYSMENYVRIQTKA